MEREMVHALERMIETKAAEVPTFSFWAIQNGLDPKEWSVMDVMMLSLMMTERERIYHG